jgi:hypothetical protein
MISQSLSNSSILMYLVIVVSLICLLNVIIQNGIQLLQLIVAGTKFAKQGVEPNRQQLWRQCDETAIPVSLIVPAYNEEDLIAESVFALAMLNRLRAPAQLNLSTNLFGACIDR